MFSFVGYICDLVDKKDILVDDKKVYGKYLIDIENGFDFYYVVLDCKIKIVVEFKCVFKIVDEFLFVIDEDCEGEVIVWYLFEILKFKVFVKCMVFYEIIKDVI